MKLTNFKYILENKTDVTWEQFTEVLASHPYRKDWIDSVYASTCLSKAIQWAPSPQGSDFWGRVCRQLIDFDDEAVEKLRALELQKDMAEDGLNIPLWDAEERIMLEDENEQIEHNAWVVYSEPYNSPICSDLSPEINREWVIGPFENLEQKEYVWNTLKSLGEPMYREQFDYTLLAALYFYDGTWSATSVEQINITPEQFLEKMCVIPFTVPETHYIDIAAMASVRDVWACGCSLLFGHSCGKEIDATKGLGLVDRELAHSALVLEIKSTIEGKKG